MGILYEQAKDKLEKEYKAFSGGRHEEIMKISVRDALLNFCRQDEEFAQAVCQGESFVGCMAAVARGVSTGISDLEAYKRAAAFYFPGADIEFTMSVNLCPVPATQEKGAGIVINLEDFF